MIKQKFSTPTFTAEPLGPDRVIGVLGGGQLGMMFAAKAAMMGYDIVIYDPDNDAPAQKFATHSINAPFDDEKSLKKFAEMVDVVTLEFENIPYRSLEFLAQYVPVRPHAEALKITQNRIREKEFFKKHKIPTAEWFPVKDIKTLDFVRRIHPKTVLKIAESGYDGKGQWMMTRTSQLPTFQGDAILEVKIDFAKEISVIVARGHDGEIVNYPPSYNIHRGHILHESIIPANISKKISEQAVAIARKIIAELDMIGLLAVEMFLTHDNQLLVNELAPRPHNSGHWSMDGANICQFELLLRAVCCLPLPTPELVNPTHMINLIGNMGVHWLEYMRHENAHYYDYGKKEMREGRKMGHVNYVRRHPPQ